MKTDKLVETERGYIMNRIEQAKYLGVQPTSKYLDYTEQRIDDVKKILDEPIGINEVAAKHWGISETHVVSHFESGGVSGAYEDNNGHWMITRRDIDNYLENSRAD